MGDCRLQLLVKDGRSFFSISARLVLKRRLGDAGGLGAFTIDDLFAKRLLTWRTLCTKLIILMESVQFSVFASKL